MPERRRYILGIPLLRGPGQDTARLAYNEYAKPSSGSAFLGRVGQSTQVPEAPKDGTSGDNSSKQDLHEFLAEMKEKWGLDKNDSDQPEQPPIDPIPNVNQAGPKIDTEYEDYLMKLNNQSSDGDLTELSAKREKYERARSRIRTNSLLFNLAKKIDETPQDQIEEAKQQRENRFAENQYRRASYNFAADQACRHTPQPKNIEDPEEMRRFEERYVSTAVNVVRQEADTLASQEIESSHRGFLGKIKSFFKRPGVRAAAGIAVGVGMELLAPEAGIGRGAFSYLGLLPVAVGLEGGFRIIENGFSNLFGSQRIDTALAAVRERSIRDGANYETARKAEEELHDTYYEDLTYRLLEAPSQTPMQCLRKVAGKLPDLDTLPVRQMRAIRDENMSRRIRGGLAIAAAIGGAFGGVFPQQTVIDVISKEAPKVVGSVPNHIQDFSAGIVITVDASKISQHLVNIFGQSSQKADYREDKITPQATIPSAKPPETIQTPAPPFVSSKGPLLKTYQFKDPNRHYQDLQDKGIFESKQLDANRQIKGEDVISLRGRGQYSLANQCYGMNIPEEAVFDAKTAAEIEAKQKADPLSEQRLEAFMNEYRNLNPEPDKIAKLNNAMGYRTDANGHPNNFIERENWSPILQSVGPGCSVA